MRQFGRSLWCEEDWVQVLDFKDGNTPLALAAAEGNDGAVREILNIYSVDNFWIGNPKEFDIDHTNSSGKTALDLAMDNGHHDIVNLIKGMREHLGESDIAATYNQREALYEDMRTSARETNHHQFRTLARNITRTTCTTEDGKFLKEILGELLQRKYPAKSVYRMVMDVLDAASRCKFKDFLCHRYEKGKTALLLAGEYGHMSLVRLLLARGANIDDEDEDKRNVLHMAAGFGDQDDVQFIIDMKCYRLFQHLSQFINYKDNGESAARYHLFVQFREFITHKDNDGKTALHYVAQSGNSDPHTAAFLCSNPWTAAFLRSDPCTAALPWSAGLIEKDNNGCTPLHCAVQLFIHKYKDPEGPKRKRLSGSSTWKTQSQIMKAIYDISPVEEQLKLFTDDQVRYDLVYCIFDGQGRKVKEWYIEWYIISAFKLIRLGHLIQIPLAIGQVAAILSKDNQGTTWLDRALQRHGLHEGGQCLPYIGKDGIWFRFEPETAP